MRARSGADELSAAGQAIRSESRRRPPGADEHDPLFLVEGVTHARRVSVDEGQAARLPTVMAARTRKAASTAGSNANGETGSRSTTSLSFAIACSPSWCRCVGQW